MEPQVIGLLGIVALLVAISLGLHIGVALGTVGFLGLAWITGSGNMGISLLTTAPWSTTAVYAFSALPLFVLMGLFAYRSGISHSLFDMAYRWLGRLPGGLAIATVVGNAGFGAVCGSSMVACAVFTKVSLPEMLRHGYDKKFACGTIAAGGMLGMLIPPSILMVVYGILTEQSIGHLLMAGIGPGLLLALIFSITSLVLAARDPRLGPPATETFTWRERLLGVKGAWGVVALAGIIVGGIYLGVFTPTEGAAVGASGAFVLALAMRKLHRQDLAGALKETGQTTAMIMMIVIGATIFARFLALSTLPTRFAQAVTSASVPPLVMIGVFMVMYLIMGCFLDSISMMSITLPVIHPMIVKMGINPIWFAMLVVMAIEIGLLTPPVGINVYTVKVSAPAGMVTLEEVFQGIVPFFFVSLIALAIMMLFPSISLLIPQTMLGK